MGPGLHLKESRLGIVMRKSCLLFVASHPAREVLEALRLKFPDSILFGDVNHVGIRRNFADARNPDTVDSLRQARNLYY